MTGGEGDYVLQSRGVNGALHWHCLACGNQDDDELPDGACPFCGCDVVVLDHLDNEDDGTTEEETE